MRYSADINALGREANGEDWDVNLTEIDGRLDANQTAASNAVVVTWSAANEVNMLALAAKKGHECKRTDEKKLYRLNGADPTVLGSWVLIAVYAAIAPEDIVNALDSDETDKALSAAQGKILDETKQSLSQKDQPDGYAGVGSDGKIPAILLPGYVDDVIEADELGDFPVTGESGKQYVAIDTGKVYRWGGTVYVEISASPGSTDAVPEGVVNKYFSDARVRTAILTAIDFTSNAVITAADSVLSAFGKIQKQITELTTLVGTKSDKTLATGPAITASQNIGSGDIGQHFEVDSATDITITINADISGYQAVFSQKAAGRILFAVSGGNVLHNFYTHTKSAGLDSTVTLLRVTANHYRLKGETDA
jgi:hypothetical protein